MKRLHVTLLSLVSIMLMLGVAPAPLHDAGANGKPAAPATLTVTHTTATVHHSSQTVPTGTAIIWCGLWNGSNFNVTDSCANIGDGSSHVTINHTSVSNGSTSASKTTVSGSSTDTDNDSDNDSGSATVTTSSQPAETTTTTTPSSSTSTTSSSSDTSNTCSSTCTNGDTQTVPTGTAIIWCGLIMGSNFNINDDCANIGDDQPTVTIPANLDQSSVSTPSSTSTSSSADPPATTNTNATTASATSSDPPNTSGGSYAALGDSVAAGAGLPLPANADANTTACDRSAQGYPNLVASSMNLGLNNLSCSGATVGDLVTPEDVAGTEQAAQINQAFANGTPKFISITAGANDAQWSTFLKECAMTNCSTTANTVAVDGLLVTLQAKLLAALSSIQLHANGSTPPRTVVTGYYDPVSVACVQKGQLTSANLTWITAATNALNQTIKQTTQEFSFARFSPVSFAGHDVCSSSSWVQGPNDPAPFHPTAQGQQEIAKDVEAGMSGN